MNPFKRHEPKHRSADTTGLDPNYSYCEGVHATPMSPHHIRALGDQGLKLGGGADSPALCGVDLHFGWDLRRVPFDDDIDALGDKFINGARLVCRGCADEYLKIRGGTHGG